MTDEEAASALLMLRYGFMSCSLPTSPPKQSVVEAIEREERVFIRVPRQKRTMRIPISPPPPPSFDSSPEIVEYVSKEDPQDHINDAPLMESPTKPAKNSKKRCRPTKQKQPKKAKRRTVRRRLAAPARGEREPTPEWLLELMRDKNGEAPKKIIDKKVTATDLSSGHSRLSMPFRKIFDLEFLSPAEERIIEEDASKYHMTGVDAKLVVPDLTEFNVSLRRWDMKKKSGRVTSVYNLVKNWKKAAKYCGLRKHDNIRVWSFHSNGKLYFALVPPPPPPPPPPSD